MRFRILAHAALWIEHGATRVLVDPWLVGTCYGGAWARVPDASDLVERLPRPDWIVYSHEHPDHFHLPTLSALLERFGLGLRVAIPDHSFGHISATLARLGCGSVTVVPSGQRLALGGDFWFTPHVVRANDAVLIFRAGGYTLVDANDAQLEGRPLTRAQRTTPAADFYFGQFAIGDAYPFALADCPAAAMRAAVREPLQRLRQQSAAFRARYVIPHASFLRFATTDNRHLNAWLATLDDVRNALTDVPGLHILYPGDGWCGTTGFEYAPEHRTAYEQAVAVARSETAPCMTREPVPTRRALEDAARARFAHMFDTIPGCVRRRMGRLGFRLVDAARSLLVDWRQRTVTWTADEPDTAYYALGAGHFLRLCEHPWGWASLHIGGRFTVHRWQDRGSVRWFLPISVLYGLGYFEPGRCGRLRLETLRAAYRRRLELADVLERAVRRRVWNDAPLARV